MGEFDGLVAVVTGGGAGIGAATVRRLHAGGAVVVSLDAREGAPPEAALGLVADVAQDDSVDSAIQKVIERCGRIDLLVNNAGIPAAGDVSANSSAEWQHLFNVNVIGIARVTRTVLPQLRLSPAPAIVNLSSITATVGVPDRALYSATKGAILSLTRAMAADHIHEGIRVCCVCPGTVDTAWHRPILAGAEDPRAVRAALGARQPHGRLVTADEVADAIAYLLSPRSGSTTGMALAVDGGADGLRLPAGQGAL